MCYVYKLVYVNQMTPVPGKAYASGDPPPTPDQVQDP